MHALFLQQTVILLLYVVASVYSCLRIVITDTSGGVEFRLDGMEEFTPGRITKTSAHLLAL
jgi:hypothetical protein